MKNSFDRLLNRLNTAKEGISEPGHKSIEIIQIKAQREKKSDVKRKRNENQVA